MRYYLSIIFIYIFLFNNKYISANSVLASTEQAEQISESREPRVKKENRRIKKAKKTIKQPQKRAQTKVFSGAVFALAGLAACSLGGILFPIGFVFSIWGLWLAGLIFLGLCLVFFLIAFSGKLVIRRSNRSDLAPIIDAILMLFLIGLMAILGISFLIWGLVIAAPLIWIIGLSFLVLILILGLIYFITGIS